MHGAALRSGITPASLSALEPDAYRGTTFEKRLLDAWYTGLFNLDGLSDVRSFDTTLMWRVAGWIPRQACAGAVLKAGPPPFQYLKRDFWPSKATC